MRLTAGTFARLGASWDGRGTNFALFSANARKVELCLFDNQGRRELERIELPERSEDVWHGYLNDISPGQLYGYRVGAVYAIAVELPGRDVVQIAMPDVFAAFGQLDALELATALVVEQAQLDLFRIRREQREIGAAAVPAGAETRKGSGSKAHRSAFRHEKDGGKRRDREAQLVTVGRVDPADIADIAATIMRGVRVQDFAPPAAERHADAVVAVDIGREIHNDQAPRPIGMAL